MKNGNFNYGIDNNWSFYTCGRRVGFGFLVHERLSGRKETLMANK
ncbi:hypothetical protein [Hydrogenivirga sp. 128-5-R1-1]|nr:hypothetical protein [Hydrogenivirga sp. 128-5-R1-1]